jgi:hypothetical protein
MAYSSSLRLSIQRQRLQARGALLEVHLHQRRDAGLAGVGDGFVEVDRSAWVW